MSEPDEDCLAMGHQDEQRVGERDGQVWWRCFHCDGEWETEAAVIEGQS